MSETDTLNKATKAKAKPKTKKIKVKKEVVVEEEVELSTLEKQMEEKNPAKIWVKTKGLRFLLHAGRSDFGRNNPYKLSDKDWCEVSDPKDVAFFLTKRKAAKFKIQLSEPAEVKKAKEDHEKSKPKKVPVGIKMSMGLKE